MARKQSPPRFAFFAFALASLTLLSIFPLNAGQSGDTWELTVPQNRLGDTQRAVAVDDKIYFLRHDFSCFDPVTGDITEKAPFTLPYKWAGKGDDCVYDAAALKGEVYIVGGVHLLAGSRQNKTEYNFVEIYNPHDNSWRNGTVPTHQIEYFPVVAVADGKLYLLDGRSGHLDVFDPVTDSWTTKTPLPIWSLQNGQSNPRIDQMITVNNRIYCFTAPSYNSLKKMTIYDTKTDTWLSGTDPPVTDTYSSYSVFACATTGRYAPQRIYYIGPESPYTPSTPFNYVYDPADNSWSTAQPLQTPDLGFYINLVLGDKIYLFLGNGSAFEVYTPIGYSATPLPPSPSPANPGANAIPLPVLNPVIFVQVGVGFVIVASIVLATIYLRKYKNKK